MKKILILTVGLVMSISVFAQNRILSSNEDIQKGIELHDNAHYGKQSDLQNAMDLLKPYVKEDATACAFYGSCLTLCASVYSEDNPIKALEYLEQGSTYLDEAVKMQPSNPLTHIIRLENGVEVSRTSPYKRYSVIKNDVDFLLEADTDGWSEESIAEAYLYCGHYMLDAGELEEALDLFDTAIEASPSSASGVAAQKMIDKYSE